MTQKTAVRARNRGVLKWILLSALPFVAIAVFLIFTPSRSFSDNAESLFSRPVRDFLGRICSLFPFSVMELLYAALIVFLIVFLVRTVVMLVAGPARLKILAKRVAVMLLIAAYILTGYLWLWGVNYRSTSFSEKIGFDVEGISTDSLYHVTRYFVMNAASLADSVPRDENGHFSLDIDACISGSQTLYDNLAKEFPILEHRHGVPKKVLFSRLMSRMGFTGVYFPFTGESNINIDAPACEIPSTIAHELAHQRGIYSEQEANFVGVAACITSDIPVYVYSGYFSGSVYLMNALYKADRDACMELFSLIQGSYLTDWEDNSAYWRSMESHFTEVSSDVYDVYLKANGQHLGIESYGACVDLLVTYYKDRI